MFLHPPRPGPKHQDDDITRLHSRLPGATTAVLRAEQPLIAHPTSRQISWEPTIASSLLTGADKSATTGGTQHPLSRRDGKEAALTRRGGLKQHFSGAQSHTCLLSQLQAGSTEHSPAASPPRSPAISHFPLFSPPEGRRKKAAHVRASSPLLSRDRSCVSRCI